MTLTDEEVVVISGGVGAARFMRGLIDVVDAQKVTAVVNVADDMVLHGLRISPDIDTVTYTLADAIDPDRGWGLRDESWNAMGALARYGNGDWFSLGDKDLATHMQRTSLMNNGATLTEATEQIAKRWDVRVSVLPVSNDRVSTMVTRADTSEEISFQEYFVGLQHDVPVSKVRFDNVENAKPTSEVLDAITRCGTVIIAPSNPIVSIAPVLAVPGMREALSSRTGAAVAISPIVGGKALKGPAANMLTELGHRCDAAGVTELWKDLVDVMLIDDADAHLASAVSAAGVIPFVTDTIMQTPQRRARLAQTALSAAALVRSNP